SKTSNSSTITRAKALVLAKRKTTKALLQEQPSKKYKIINSSNKEVKKHELATSKENWNDIISQENPWLNSNKSLQKTELGKQNNKATHMSKKVPESSASSSHVEMPSKSPEPPVNPYIHVLTNELKQEATWDKALLKQPLQEEPTITEVQEELSKENIPVSNQEETPKENTENLANLDTMIIYAEEVTKKNDETDNKRISLLSKRGRKSTFAQ
ncbi:11005_t:CDS:2, partial [Dentiscutata erythropus]